MKAKSSVVVIREVSLDQKTGPEGAGQSPPDREAVAAAAGPVPEKVTEILVKQRGKPVDPHRVNDNLLELIRKLEREKPLTRKRRHSAHGLSRHELPQKESHRGSVNE